MQLKWLEDFVALAQERSFTRAAELRHVTHPAFGRRIRALESWAGTPLIEREAGPVKLTAAGQAFLDTALQMTRHLAQSHDELMAIAGRQGRTVTLCTGRTLARTIVADWLVRLRPYLADGELRISTRSLADAVHDLQHGLANFPSCTTTPRWWCRWTARQFEHIALATDRLLPISRTDASGAPCTCWKPAARLCPTSPTTAPLRWGAWWKTCWLTTPWLLTSSAWWSAIRPMPTTNTCAKGWAFHGRPGLWCMPTSNGPAGPGRWQGAGGEV